MIAASLLLAATAIISSATAFTMPGNLTNGIYRASIVDGVEIHEAVTSADFEYADEKTVRVRGSSPNPNLEARFGKGQLSSWCGCSYPLGHSDCDNAVQQLKNQMGGGTVQIKFDTAWYSIWGGTVAFACNNDDFQYSIHGAKSASMSDEYLREGFEYITSRCGSYIAGTMLWTDWFGDDVQAFVGYMQYYNGLDFCGNGELSHENHC